MKTRLYCVLVLGLVSICLAPPLIPIDGAVTKCSIKAGKADGKDSITCSGSLDATDEILSAAEDIVVTVGTAGPWTFPVDAVTYQNGRYRYNSKTDGSLFQWDVKTRKMTFSDKTADLTGLVCPMDMKIQIGVYEAQIVLDEDVVNGTKPCPPQLLMGAVNSLQVSRRTLTFGQTLATDTLMVDGYFTIEGIYDDVSDLVIHVGDQEFTVSRNQITSRGKMIVESCANAGAFSDNGGGVVTATFDFNKCTFRLTLRNATLTGSGVVPFGFTLFDKDLTGLATIDLGSIYTYWELTQYDQPDSIWAYDTSVGAGAAGVYVYSDGPDGYEVQEDEIDATAYFFLEKEISELAVLTNLIVESSDSGVTISLDSDLIIWPDFLRPGQTWTGGSSMSGYMGVYGNTIDIVNGIASAKVVMAPVLSRVAVPAGTYDAVKYDETLTYQGYLDWYNDGVYEGTIQIIFYQTNYAVADLGVVKRIRKLTIKAKVYGSGGFSDSVQETYLLNHE